MQIFKFNLCLTAFLLLLSNPLQARPVTQADLKTMAGQMIILGFRGERAGPYSWIVRTLRQGAAGGVILFDYDLELNSPKRNIQNPSQVKLLIENLKKSAHLPLLVAIDQEGGRVSRLKPKHGFRPFPSAAELGSRNSPSYTHKIASKMGYFLSKLGINLNLAPVVDLNLNPLSPAIGKLKRSFSKDPERVSKQAEHFIKGLHSKGILSCIKHFPGHGSARQDSHKDFTEITRTWKKEELIPYKKLIPKKLPDMIMTGHLYQAELDPDYPATLSKKILKKLLREKLGYKGVIISDDLQMGAIQKHYRLKQTIRLAIQAGIDILLFANNLDYDPKIGFKARKCILDLVRSGQISSESIQKSYARIMKLKRSL